MNLEQSFGLWLKQRRKALDLTQEVLAQCVGCSVVTLQKIEANERRPSKQIAERLANCLDLPDSEHLAFIKFARIGLRAKQPALLPQSIPSVPSYTPHRHPSNLPVPPTALIGREQDLADIWNCLRQEEVRLLTLTGAPGIGKTRLALQVAAELTDQFEDGVFFVSLAPISDPDLVAATIARTLGILETESQTALDSLRYTLRDKQMLLVLDNFEQVVSAAPQVAELLTTCTRLRILVTSRAVLHIRGERRFPVPPLALPDLTHSVTAQVLSNYPAVALFLECARAIRPDFALTRANAPVVAAICARLDGLPLAIELVAAHSRMLLPQTLLARLADGHLPLQMLADGPRDLPARQQTLRDAIGWSYNLLDAGEKILFARLGVFIGSFSLDAAEAVCNAAQDLPIDIVDGVSSLLNKSLLLHATRAQDAGEVRLVMLETIRDFALECLAASGEAGDIGQAHLKYYLALAVTAAPHLIHVEQTHWLNRLELDYHNLRAALRWAIDSKDAATAMRLSVALWRFWFMHGHLREGRKWLREALSTGNWAPAALRAEARKGAGVLARAQGDYAQAEALLEKSLALYQALEDTGGMASVINNLGLVMLNQSDFERAGLFFEESRSLFQEVGNRRGLAFANLNLGTVVLLHDDVRRATSLYDESLLLFRDLGDKHGIAMSLNNRGLVALIRGDLERARALFKESLALMQELGDKGAIAWVLESFARLAEAQGQPVRVARLLGAVEALREAIGSPLPLANHFDHEHTIASAHAQLDETTFAAIWAQGRAIALDQAIAYALANEIELKIGLPGEWNTESSMSEIGE